MQPAPQDHRDASLIGTFSSLFLGFGISLGANVWQLVSSQEVYTSEPPNMLLHKVPRPDMIIDQAMIMCAQEAILLGQLGISRLFLRGFTFW